MHYIVDRNRHKQSQCTLQPYYVWCSINNLSLAPATTCKVPKRLGELLTHALNWDLATPILLRLRPQLFRIFSK